MSNYLPNEFPIKIKYEVSSLSINVYNLVVKDNKSAFQNKVTQETHVSVSVVRKLPVCQFYYEPVVNHILGSV